MSKQSSDYNVIAATKYVSNGKINAMTMDIERIFGENTFGLEEMKSRLPESIYASILATIREG